MARALSATGRVYRNWVPIEELPAPPESPDPTGLDTIDLCDWDGGPDEVALYYADWLLRREGVTITCNGGRLYRTDPARLHRRAMDRYGSPRKFEAPYAA